MFRKLSIECENCETQSLISIEKGFDVDIINMVCPFCGENLDDVEELEENAESTFEEENWEDES